MTVDLSYKNSPKPGPVRQFVIVGLCAILTIAGIASTVVSYRQRQEILRGWQNAATLTGDLPQHVPLTGVNVELTQYQGQALADTLDQIAATGMTWVRQTFRWSDIEATQGTLDFSQYDLLVNAVAVHPTLQLVAVIDESPSWARHSGAEGNRFAPPADPSQFTSFVSKFAAHYGDKIKTYQIWDEPNLADQWGGLDPAPTLYFAMLRSAYGAIHDAVPNATVIAAALAPTVEHGPHNISDLDYLSALYTLGAKPYFDAAAAKPYGFNSSPDDRTLSPDTLNFSRIVLMREVMKQFGDTAKPLWGSDFGWNSLPIDWANAPSVWGQVTSAQQESFTRAAYQRASREWPWIGGLILEHWQPATPTTDPLQGFAIHDRVAQWIKDSVFPSGDPDSFSGNGLYPMTDSRLQYSGAWRTGALGAESQPSTDPNVAPSTVSVVIDGGTSGGQTVALRVRRDDYVAYLYPTLDGQPVSGLPHDPDGQAYLLLTSPDRLPHTDLITIIPNLSAGRHTLTVRAYLGYDHYPLVTIAIGTPAATHDDDMLIAGGLLLTVIGLIGTLGFGRQLPWDRLTVWRAAMVGYSKRMRGLTATVLVSIVTAAGVLLTWGGTLPNVFRRDPPTLLLTALTAGLIYFSPAFLLTAASLLVLFVIIYNRPALGLALVVFWIPFFLFPVQLYLTAAPMVEISLIVTAIALTVRGGFGWLGSLKQPDRKPFAWGTIQLQPLDWAVVALVAIAVITLTWSEQRAPALRELRTMILEPALFYVLIRLTKLTRTDMLRLVDSLLIAALLVCVIGFVEYFHIAGTGGVIVAEQGSQRLASVYGSPNNVALFLGRCLPFALAMALFPLSRPRRIMAAVLAAIMLIAVLLTQSVGALALGLPAAALIVLLAWNLRIGALITVGIGVLGALGLVVLPKFVPRLQGALDGTRASSFVRTELWQSTINLLRERPLTGAGLDQFLYLYRSRYILPDAWREPDLSHPHNFFLDYWVSLGFAGVVLLIAMQAAFWRSAAGTFRRVRKADPLLAALVVGAMGSMADFLAHGLVDNSYFVVDLSFVFCLTLALVAWLRRESEMTTELK
jgi:O-antigen ligase